MNSNATFSPSLREKRLGQRSKSSRFQASPGALDRKELVVERHHVRRPVRRTYRHYNVTQSMSLFVARGYPLPSRSFRQGSNVLEQGRLLQNAHFDRSALQSWWSDMQCVEVLTENDVDPDFPLMDKTEIYNCTSVTCYQPGVGPIFTYLRQNAYWCPL